MKRRAHRRDARREQCMNSAEDNPVVIRLIVAVVRLTELIHYNGLTFLGQQHWQQFVVFVIIVVMHRRL